MELEFLSTKLSNVTAYWGFHCNFYQKVYNSLQALKINTKRGGYYMIKVNIMDHTTRQVMDSFKPADVKDLPADLVNFIKKLPKGDKLKPMEKDTFQLSTYKTSEMKKYGGYTIPAERNVEIILPRDENCGYYARLTDNKKDLERKENGVFPISVKGFKDAIRSIAQSKKVF